MLASPLETLTHDNGARGGVRAHARESRMRPWHGPVGHRRHSAKYRPSAAGVEGVRAPARTHRFPPVTGSPGGAPASRRRPPLAGNGAAVSPSPLVRTPFPAERADPRGIHGSALAAAPARAHGRAHGHTTGARAPPTGPAARRSHNNLAIRNTAP